MWFAVLVSAYEPPSSSSITLKGFDHRLFGEECKPTYKAPKL